MIAAGCYGHVVGVPPFWTIDRSIEIVHDAAVIGVEHVTRTLSGLTRRDINHPVLLSAMMTSNSFDDPAAILDAAFRDAIHVALGDEFAETDPLIKRSNNPEFGDFQANFAMPLAKRIGRNPREVAQQVLPIVTGKVADICEPPDAAGPGFINLTLRPDALSTFLKSMQNNQLGLASNKSAPGETVVIDMCSVNVAKQMHVGHLRSTIIGDTLARVLERIGHTVIRQNHLGDWGLQIGMVLHMLRASNTDLDTLTLPQLEAAYRDAQLACKADDHGLKTALQWNSPHHAAELEEQNAGANELLTQVKQTLNQLQQGNEELVSDWKKLIDVTMKEVYSTVAMLNVELPISSERGESSYRDMLGDVVSEFEQSGVAHEDDGALVVPFEDRERPMLIRKSDGGFLYATTDLAAIRYRVQELHADRVIYVVGAPQREHFRDVFEAAKLIGWDRRNGSDLPTELAHTPFGSVLGKDNKMLKTRSGENVKLRDLLEEAIERGTAEVAKRAEDPKSPTHGASERELREIGTAVGIGAVKYADLSSDLVKDYVLDFDRMLAFEGNTGPYIQYAHARICSIFAKADDYVSFDQICIHESAEKTLALLLLRYSSVVHDVASSLEPHRLCTYLYDLANAYSSFYQACPVLKADDESVRNSRLTLSALTRDVIADGLGLLGIDSPSRM